MSSRGELILVALLVLAQLILLAAQVQQPEADGSLLGVLGTGLVTPFASGVDGVVRSGEEMALRWRNRRALLADNERLREELRRSRLQIAEQQGAVLELRRLRESLGYEPPEGYRMRVANVVYANHRDLLRRLAVRVLEGGDDELDDDAAVVTEEGLVGRVISVQPPYAKVQLLTDRNSSVGAMVERTRRQGLVRGAGDNLVLDYLPLQSDVREGDRVVTAGIDGVYPRGILVGTVASVEPGEGLFHRIAVVPAVDLGRLDQVFLLEALLPGEEITAAEIGDDEDPDPASAIEASGNPGVAEPPPADGGGPEG